MLTGIENIIGSNHDDNLTALTASAGQRGSVLTGGRGEDTLNDGAGNDTLNGGTGDDTLNGSTGGMDIFVFAPA